LKGQLGETLEVPQGGDTTLQELVRLAAKASRIAQKRVVIKYGFPPKKIEEERLAERSTTTIAQAGIQNKEVLVIERGDPGQGDRVEETKLSKGPGSGSRAPTKAPAAQPGGSGASAGTPKRTLVPAGKTKVRITKSGEVKHKRVMKRKKRIKMPSGAGRTLAGASSLEEAADNDSFVLGRARDGHDAAVARIGAELVSAGRNSGTKDTLKSSALKSLRQTFRAARQQHGAYVEAEEKVAACMAGRSRFENMDDQSGRIRCIYTKTTGRKEKEECVTDIPGFLLKAILKQIASEDDQVQVQNLMPVNMALVSPRVFWSVVRHGKVGPGVTFTQALEFIVPDVDWNKLIEQRKRARPEKYGDYVPH